MSLLAFLLLPLSFLPLGPSPHHGVRDGGECSGYRNSHRSTPRSPHPSLLTTGRKGRETKKRRTLSFFFSPPLCPMSSTLFPPSSSRCFQSFNSPLPFPYPVSDMTAPPIHLAVQHFCTIQFFQFPFPSLSFSSLSHPSHPLFYASAPSSSLCVFLHPSTLPSPAEATTAHTPPYLALPPAVLQPMERAQSQRIRGS